MDCDLLLRRCFKISVWFHCKYLIPLPNITVPHYMWEDVYLSVKLHSNGVSSLTPAGLSLYTFGHSHSSSCQCWQQTAVCISEMCTAPGPGRLSRTSVLLNILHQTKKRCNDTVCSTIPVWLDHEQTWCLLTCYKTREKHDVKPGAMGLKEANADDTVFERYSAGKRVNMTWMDSSPQNKNLHSLTLMSL